MATNTLPDVSIDPTTGKLTTNTLTDPDGNIYYVKTSTTGSYRDSGGVMQGDPSTTRVKLVDTNYNIYGGGDSYNLDDLINSGWSIGKNAALTPDQQRAYGLSGALSDTGTVGGPTSTGYPDTSTLAGGGGSDNTADTRAATLLREQFAEWESTFKPIEEAQMQELSFNNPDVLNKWVGAAGGTARDFYRDVVPGIISRENAAMGVQPTAQQQAVSNRIINLDEGAAVAGSENLARTNVRTQDEQILYGATPKYATGSGSSTY